MTYTFVHGGENIRRVYTTLVAAALTGRLGPDGPAPGQPQGSLGSHRQEEEAGRQAGLAGSPGPRPAACGGLVLAQASEGDPGSTLRAPRSCLGTQLLGQGRARVVTLRLRQRAAAPQHREVKGTERGRANHSRGRAGRSGSESPTPPSTSARAPSLEREGLGEGPHPVGAGAWGSQVSGSGSQMVTPRDLRNRAIHPPARAGGRTLQKTPGGWAQASQCPRVPGSGQLQPTESRDPPGAPPRRQTVVFFFFCLV